jgi:hypothetical protein
VRQTVGNISSFYEPREADEVSSLTKTLLAITFKNILARHLQSQSELLDNFIKMFRALIEINARSGDSLISDEGNYDNLITKTYNDINIASFYGQNIVFHVNLFRQYLDNTLELLLRAGCSSLYSIL